MNRVYKPFISVIFVLTGVFSTMFGQNTSSVKRPDFAYPKNVSSISWQNLEAALAKHDTRGVLRNLLDYTVAQSMISGDKIKECIDKIDSISTQSDDTILKSLLSLLEADIYNADIYNNVYMSAKWRYDKRPSSVDGPLEDYAEWNGKQFRDKISSLVDKMLSDSLDLNKIKLSDYSNVITQDSFTTIYYPTLLSFVLDNVIGIYSGWGDEYADKVFQIYDYIIENSNRDSAPGVMARIGLINYSRSNGMVSPYDVTTDDNESPFLSLYQSYISNDGCPTSVYAGDILLDVVFYDIKQKKDLYSCIKSFLNYYPNYWRKDCLLRRLNDLEQKNLSVLTPRVTGPGREVEFVVDLCNVANAAIEIYDVSSSSNITDNFMFTSGMQGAKLLSSLPINITDETIPFETKRVVRYTFNRIGNYIAVPKVDGNVIKKESFQKIHVTNFALFATDFKERKIWAVNAADGSPQSGVEISQNKAPYKKESVTKRIGLTDIDGSLNISDFNGVFLASKGEDKYALPLNLYGGNYQSDPEWKMAAGGFTSLPVYHPGDTVEWVAVCYEYKGKLHRSYSSREVEAVMYDANNSAVDTLKIFTDKFGRANGKFAIPEDVLTGRFNISIDNHWGIVSFEVSDYKLPTFMIVSPKAERDAPKKGDVTIRGKVMTYSGFYLANVSVDVSISVSPFPRWWRPSSTQDIYENVTQTDQEGKFEIVIPDSIFNKSSVANGYYSVKLKATSQSGESQTASLSFGRGERYFIISQLPANFDMSQKKLPLEANVVNYEDSIVGSRVGVSVIRGDSIVSKTILDNGVGSLDVSGFKQGVYTIAMYCENADTVRQQVTFYDPEAKESPVEDRLLWSPTNEIQANANTGKAEWLYASECDTHLLINLSTEDELIERKWLKVNKGFNTVSISLPDYVDVANLNVVATGNYKSESCRISVKRTNSAKGLKIITETFRDNLNPGSDETWTFRVVDMAGHGTEAAVIADLYNTALDAIASSRWGMAYRTDYVRSFEYLLSNIGALNSHYMYIPLKQWRKLECRSLLNPDFNTYGYPLVRYMGSTRGAVRNLTMKSALNAKVDTDEIAVDEVEEEVAEAPMFYTSAADAGSADVLTGVEEHKSVVAVEETAALAEPAGENAKTPTYNYRDGEVALAFFRPMLTTDKDGRLEIKFTVPNANTTWGFKAIALTESLISPVLSEEVVASKKVMVQPNLPRFLRAGDSIDIKASVMNNSDDSLKIATKIEIFDPISGKVLIVKDKTDNLAASSDCVVSMIVDVPQGMTMLGYRIKSSSDGYSDGEQTAIPILPASTAVVESSPFYLSPGQQEFSVTLPDLPDDASVTVQFCDNPIWYVVTALPGIMAKGSTTSVEAARAVYSASVAYGLMRKYPEISQAIEEWSQGDKSSEMLTSMLQRNESLKMLLLNSTPWMSNAKDDTERMTRLSLLLNKKNVENIIDKNITLLRNLYCDDGGWSWCASFYGYSEWATQNVLRFMGRLNLLGFIPENNKLKRMLGDALEAYSKRTLKSYLKYPKSDYTQYVTLFDMYDGDGYCKPDDRIVNSVVQNILKNWKNHSLSQKAIDAQILYRHNYKTMSRRVLGSISQFGETSPEKGMWFPSLDDYWFGNMDKVGITSLVLETYNLIEPGCIEIDGLRQWLIMQKGAEDWGGSQTASEAVAAILSTSDRWQDEGGQSVIKIGDTDLKPDKFEKYTGEFSTYITGLEAKGNVLSISRQSETPAWGGIYYRYVSDISDVKAVRCPDLSIEKHLPSYINTGQRVTVTLTIKAETDMDYVAIIDERAACFEPVEQLPGTIYADGLRFYRENLDASTRIFIDHLPKGTYVLSYDVWANNRGRFASGIATVQSQYAPRLSAHSAGTEVKVY